MYEKFLYATGGSKFRSVAIAIIKSAMALFAFQAVLVGCSIVPTGPVTEVAKLTIGTHQTLLVSLLLLLILPIT